MSMKEKGGAAKCAAVKIQDEQLGLRSEKHNGSKELKDSSNVEKRNSSLHESLQRRKTEKKRRRKSQGYSAHLLILLRLSSFLVFELRRKSNLNPAKQHL